MLVKIRFSNFDFSGTFSDIFIEDSSKDVIFCHWALTLMDPVVPVLKTVKRILKNQGIFSAIVDGDSRSATGYLEIYNLIYKYVKKIVPNYGLLGAASAVGIGKVFNNIIHSYFISNFR